ncbi:MAG: hypothetical protein NT059_07810 [Planctomycetota bacterium]|nr:hypothetical protein [Planctomycetota bacterium]
MTWERSAPSASNPLAWSLPLFPIAGIHFRVHFTFIAYALIVVLRGSYGPAEESSVHGVIGTRRKYGRHGGGSAVSLGIPA